MLSAPDPPAARPPGQRDYRLLRHLADDSRGGVKGDWAGLQRGVGVTCPQIIPGSTVSALTALT